MRSARRLHSGFPDWERLEAILGWKPEHSPIYVRALIHSSYVNEHRNERFLVAPGKPLVHLGSNERLEFLGDAVLELVVSEELFRRYPDWPEGELTKLRAAVVSSESLARTAAEIGLGELLLLGRGEALSGGKTRPSLLEDAFEALCGAIYVVEGERGLERARSFILRHLGPQIEQAVRGGGLRDAKNRLQEWAQRQGFLVTYRLVATRGPDHAKEFEVEVELGGRVLGRGVGHSKKDAELFAAQQALLAVGGGAVQHALQVARPMQRQGSSAPGM
ncbi:MAG: ribonuclease III [Bacillota bacterium]|nr:ribonuclease III [Bacillota bacterium]